MTDINQNILAVREYIAQKPMKPYRLAINAGLSKNALAGVDSDAWSPTADTLRTVEAYMKENPPPPPQANDGAD
ncbi:MAG: hypothetical protein KAI73_05190 [Rhodospirillaceae bacterium]|nr:hypothetical protein [Rhodospirillaceae bacterium]